MPEAWVQYAGTRAPAVGDRRNATAYSHEGHHYIRCEAATRNAHKELGMRSTQTAMRGVTILAWLTMVLLVTECHAQESRSGPAPSSPQPDPVEGVVTVEMVASGLEHPWALAFLPDGRILVTERPGRLRIVDTSGRLSEPLAGVPQVQ